MKTLVTGGAGFIGSHLCDALIEEGHEVWCLDNFMSGRRENIAHLLSHPRFHLIRHDVRKPLRWRGPLDRLYHLACPASPVYYQFDPVETLETAVYGTREMLRVAEDTGARFLLTSTSEVYGDPLEHPQKETYHGNVDPLCAKACYEEGKRAAETLTKDHRERRGMDTRIVRYFNVYGSRMLFHDGRVVSNFVRQALFGEDLTVHGDGRQTRSFLYISDAVCALTGIMELPPEKGFGPYNIGNPDERTIAEFADRIIEMTGGASRKRHIPAEELPGRAGDSRRRCPDISRLRGALPSWRPEIALDDGLDATIKDFRGRLGDKSRILVIIPSFYPEVGPAEKLVMDVAERLRDWRFDVLTARTEKTRPRHERIGAVDVHRLGPGTAADKYLLPLLAPFKARQLANEKVFSVIWAIPASYGALSAVLMNAVSMKRLPVLSSRFPSPGRADWRSRFGETLAGTGDRKQVVNTTSEEGLEEAASKLRSTFQDLEILGTK